MKASGVVYLVGAGPGDPGLLTVRAKELLERADVVAYDDLISSSIIALISPHAELIPIGYRGHGSSKLTYGLHPVVIEKARAGKNVVRLKSGDPFIFGRGSQECLALNEEGIRYEIIPGVSSALGASAYAGFPLTHRDISSDVVFASGHDLRGGSPSKTNWKHLAEMNGTVVIYMAATKIAENCERLIELGKKKETPAVYIACATCGNEKIIQGTLEDLGELTRNVDKKLQALIIIGEVVQTREYFNWRKYLPLANKKILVLQQRKQVSRLAMELKELGADVIVAPHIETKILKENFVPQILLKNHHLLFSDKIAVESFFECLTHANLDVRNFIGYSFYTMDETTTKALKERGINHINSINGHCGSAIRSTSLPLALLIIGSAKGRKVLIDELKALGHEIYYLPIYEKDFFFPRFSPPSFDAVIAPSSSTVEVCLQSAWRDVLLTSKIYCIGENTFKVCKENGADAQMSETDTLQSIIELVVGQLDGGQ